MGEHVSGKADRAEGLLRLRETDTSLITKASPILWDSNVIQLLVPGG
jgi:hypothetical protein